MSTAEDRENDARADRIAEDQARRLHHDRDCDPATCDIGDHEVGVEVGAAWLLPHVEAGQVITLLEHVRDITRQWVRCAVIEVREPTVVYPAALRLRDQDGDDDGSDDMIVVLWSSVRWTLTIHRHADDDPRIGAEAQTYPPEPHWSRP